MLEQFARTASLIGEENVEKLQNSKVAVYGIGGVGSFVVEGLVRGGIGNIILIDNDEISITNLNRQIHADINTIGKPKAKTMTERVLNINPKINIEFYNPKDMNKPEEDLIDKTLDYVVDAVDTVSTKIKIIEKAKKENVKIISCMGTGNKLDPTKFEIADINKTSVCPLARIMRKELKKRNMKGVKVLYSKEEPVNTEFEENGRKVPASISFVPSVAGLIIAGEVIKDIIK